MSSEARVLISHDSILRRFLKLVFRTEGDGSLYIIFERSGRSEDGAVFRLGKPDSVVHHSCGQKGFRLSYHTSGRVHGKGLTGSPCYYEPLFRITGSHHLVTISIPSLDRLDQSEGDTSVEAAILTAKNERTTFSITLTPWNFPPHINLRAAVAWKEWFSVFVVQSFLPEECVPAELDDYFIYMRPECGLYPSQVVTEEEAYISFHQKAAATREMIIYGPNVKGEYRVVYAVPMLRTPTVSIEFVEPGLTAEIRKVTNHYVRFRVNDAHGQRVKQPKAIKQIELNAEL